MDLSDEVLVAMAASVTAIAAAYHFLQQEQDLQEESSLTSSDNETSYVDEILDGSRIQCREHFRMDKTVFNKFCGVLQSRGLLHNTNRVRIEEQLAIFLLTIGRNERNRVLQDHFRYSGETISRHFNNVLKATAALAPHFLKPPTTQTPPEIINNSLFHPYFQDCIGVIGGTHIPAMVNLEGQQSFHNHRGFTSQNVMAACSFDMRFQYVLAGWQGSATDFSVLHSALSREDRLHVHPGKYYLVSAGYGNLPGFMAPYTGVRYHLSGFPDDHPPENPQELFNYRHSLLHSAIDLTFSALKTPFPGLTRPPPYPFDKQVKLVVAACVIHNHVKEERKTDWIFQKLETEILSQIEAQVPLQTEESSPDFEPEQQVTASLLRDSIAQAMWNDCLCNFHS
ncbi:protein ALP1-like [Aristolochia californica]|uniref:protein ALP1-like n=1 Tax=Aristolochia californica TaxID=171875 RepID=UPI0035DD7B78